MSEEEIISRHLQKYVDKMEVWRSKQRYEDHKEKYESEEAFERYVDEKVSKGLKEARAKIERVVKMKREKNRATTTTTTTKTTKSSSVPFSPDRQFPYKVLKLGLEIRAGLVNIATEFSNRLELTDRVCFLHANVTADLVRNAFVTYPGKIRLVCFQLPDPRLEKNLSRRGAKLLTKKRVLDQDLCNAFVTMMCVGSTIYLSSDYEEVFDETLLGYATPGD